MEIKAVIEIEKERILFRDPKGEAKTIELTFEQDRWKMTIKSLTFESMSQRGIEILLIASEYKRRMEEEGKRTTGELLNLSGEKRWK